MWTGTRRTVARTSATRRRAQIRCPLRDRQRPLPGLCTNVRRTRLATAPTGLDLRLSQADIRGGTGSLRRKRCQARLRRARQWLAATLRCDDCGAGVALLVV